MGRELIVTVGCDPELFVQPKKPKANPVSAWGLIPGTKYDPHKILDGMVQVDGCALEFGIDPARTAEEWFQRIKSVMGALETLVPQHKILIQPTAQFDVEYWNRDVPEGAKELGCEPDFNAWTGRCNPKPDTSLIPTLRTAAGHIHIGWCSGKDINDKNHIEDCRLVAKQMDYYVGIWSLLWDPDSQRRLLYGRAGAHRVKPYGVEYRVPSNMWLSHTCLIDWVYYSTRLAVNHLANGKSAEAQFKDSAQKIIDENLVNWPQDKSTSKIYQAFHPVYGVKQLLKYPQGHRGPIWG